ncbi:MAG: UbiD family decarboxylase [Firmicutes bacterium]|nr:UbiD family decarboxylase [Bacillota bacterium]
MNKLDLLKNSKDRMDKIMLFTAVLTKELQRYGIKPVLVGGSALEFYTQGNYTTLDIDLVVQGRERVKTVLEKMGFDRGYGEKSWYNEELELSVEILDDTLAGSMERIITVNIDEDMVVYVIGIEDLIIDRLNAYKWWKSLSDGEWATAAMAIHYEDIDFEYMESRSQEELIEDVYLETVKKAELIRKIK